jgi:hypothetical protein
MELRELGEAVGGIDYRSAGAAIRKLEERMCHDEPLRQRVTKGERQLQKAEMWS